MVLQGVYCKHTILSQRIHRKDYNVWFDNRRGNVFLVKKPTGTLRFIRGKTGLYQYDASRKAMVMVTNVEGNKEGFTK